jgi:hypothetical protein
MEPVPPDRMPGERKLESLAEYDAAFDELLAHATHTVRIFDRKIGRNFNTPQRHDLIAQFLLGRSTNRVRIVLHETANVVRDCPRLMMLLKRFSHGLSIRQTLPAARRIYDPFAVADDTRFVRRFHYADVHGAATIGDVAATSLLIKRFEELWEASSPSVASTQIGL